MHCKLNRLAAGMDEAVHLLGASHGRLCTGLDALGKLAQWVREHGADASARQAVGEVRGRLRAQAGEPPRVRAGAPVATHAAPASMPPITVIGGSLRARGPVEGADGSRPGA